MPDRPARQPRWGAVPITGLRTVQMHIGGLVDQQPAGEQPIHLVRVADRRGGTPGPLLCGLDQHALGGFSVGGGSYSPSLGDEDPATVPCDVCVHVAARMSLTAGHLHVDGTVGGPRAARAVAAAITAMGADGSVQRATRELAG